MNDVDAVLGALADPTRRRIVELLGRRAHRAGELAEALDASAPAMSRHLRVLLETGVVADERVPTDARVRLFRLRPERVEALQAWLDQVHAHWREQLGSFRRHAEREGT